MKPLSIYVLCVTRFALETFIRPVILVLFKLYYKYYEKTDYPRPLPKCKSELLTMPAVELARKIRNKEKTSYEVVKVYIERIKEVNPLLNCVVHTMYNEALEEAKKVDKILAGDLIPDEYSEKRAPLLGVPFSCKECFFVAGCPNTTGVFARKDFIPTEDADVVRYMRESGAILTCLTNTSEACMWLESSNYYYGTTRNPYNLSRIVGGSSGGEGCIVASGGSVMGIGSDIGGSIRMPAFFNGVYGHKPSSMLISNEKQHPNATGYQTAMLGTGPICRYASDLKLLFKVFAGPNYERVAKNFESPVDFKSLKFYYVDSMQGNMLFTKYSPDALNALNSAKNFIEQSFKTQVKELKLPNLKKATQIWMSMMANGQKRSNKFSVILNDGKEPINPYCELVKSLTFTQKRHTLPALGLAIAERLPNPNPSHYIELGKKLSQEIREILGQDGVLLFPSFPVCAPYHNQALLTNTFDYITYGIINSLGLPATQCPMGLSKEALPMGVQIVANHNCDHLTISLAEYFEANLVGWTPAFDTL